MTLLHTAHCFVISQTSLFSKGIQWTGGLLKIMLVLFSGYLGQGKCMWNSGENVIQSYYIADFTKDFFLTYFLFLC